MQVSSTGRGSARIALSLGGSARRQVDHLGLVRDPRPRFQRIAECPELLLGDAVHAHQQIELGDRKQLGRAAEAKRVQRTDVLIGGGDDRLQLLGHVLRLVVARTEEQETLLILPYENGLDAAPTPNRAYSQGTRCETQNDVSVLVSRFRSSPKFAARSDANLGIEGH